ASSLKVVSFLSSRRRHTRLNWSSDVCSSDLGRLPSRRLISSGSLYLPCVIIHVPPSCCAPTAPAAARTPARLSLWHRTVRPERRSEERRGGNGCRSGWLPSRQ